MTGRSPKGANSVDIITACRNPRLWGPWFRDPATWFAWFTLLKVVWGLPLDDDELAVFRECTGRDKPAPGGYFEIWLCLGRRAGKSFILALQGVFAAVFVDWSPYLAPGERSIVLITAATTRQARAILGYAKALISRVPALSAMIERETMDAIELNNGISIEVQVCSFKTIRSVTCVFGAADELAFWDGPDSANPAAEVLAALRPAMASVPAARLFCASSPYGKFGPLYDAVDKHFGRDDSPVLVWWRGTRPMNPTISERTIADAMQQDPLRAAREYEAQFTDTDSTWLDKDLIRSAVDVGVVVRPPIAGTPYVMFIDPSSGRGDSFTASVGHTEDGGIIVQDAVLEVVAPFNPSEAIAQVRDLYRQYAITSPIISDRYAVGFMAEGLSAEGLPHQHSRRDRTQIYLGAAPYFTAGKVRLLDNPRLASQLTGLVRRVSPSGRDAVNHVGAGTHDDVANSTCGMILAAADAAETQIPFAVPYIARNSPDPFFSDRGVRITNFDIPRWGWN